MLALTGTGYGLIGIMLIVLIVVMIVDFVVRRGRPTPYNRTGRPHFQRAARVQSPASEPSLKAGPSDPPRGPAPGPSGRRRSRVARLALATFLLALLLLPVVRIVPASAGNLTTTFAAVEDSYVSSGSRSTNYGTASSLKLATSPAETAYLKFNLSGLSGPVQSATLRVYANSGLKWGFDAYSTANTSWTESTVTYNNAPALGTKLGSFPSGTQTGWIQLDVTPAVTGNGTYSFALVGTYWMEIALASRESGANAPQLLVTTAGTPDTTPPTPPTNLAATNPTATTLPLTWSASTDNVAVTGYDIYLNGSKLTTATATSYTFSNLTCGTTYTLGVDAFDAAGNVSSRSTITATTAGCAPTTTTSAAVEDSYVSSGSRSTNYGTASSLKLATSPAETAYLKFNLSGLSGPVQSATLRVYANSGLKWGFDAYSTANTSWTESTVTYNNAPALGTKLGSFPSGTQTGWVQLDVTPAVTGNGTYSFALVGTYWMEIALASRESGANAPQLLVTTAGTPDTTPPTVSITSPPGGAQISGTINVQALASDDTDRRRRAAQARRNRTRHRAHVAPLRAGLEHVHSRQRNAHSVGGRKRRSRQHGDRDSGSGDGDEHR